MSYFSNNILPYITIYITNIVDIILVAVGIYLLLKVARKGVAFKLIWGLVIIIGIAFLTNLFGLKTSSYLIDCFLPLAPLVLVVIFFPDLRKILEDLGNLNPVQKNKHNTEDSVINIIVKAVIQLSSTKTGALIVFERDNKLNDIISNGISMNSDINNDLLRTIFYEGTPLHDGALIIRNNKIVAAACTLPLTSNENFSNQIHTRHKAAIGISEKTDALALVVSEETGIISVALDGKLDRHFTKESLTELLEKELLVVDKVENKSSSLLKFFNK